MPICEIGRRAPPRWEGGPLFWAKERAAALAGDLDWLRGVSGAGLAKRPPGVGRRRLAHGSSGVPIQFATII